MFERESRVTSGRMDTLSGRGARVPGEDSAKLGQTGKFRSRGFEYSRLASFREV